VRRGRIQEFYSGVYFDHSNGGTVRGLKIGPGGTALSLWDSDSNVIERNTLESGINLYADSDANTIDRNTIATAGTLILVAGFGVGRIADGDRITRNRLIGSGDSYGVYALGADDLLVQGNDIRRHSATGVAVTQSNQRNRILGNTIANTGLGGITVDGSARYTEVAGNRVTGAAADGIRLGSSTRDTLVARNVAKRNGDDGIDSDTASATLTGNVANFNFDLGIEAVAGVTDGGGNRAQGNGNPAQCVGVSCS
jgi:parallel beta-helix repeat protein